MTTPTTTNTSTAGEPITTGGGTEIAAAFSAHLPAKENLALGGYGVQEVHADVQIKIGGHKMGGFQINGRALYAFSEALGAEPHPIPAEVHAPDKPSGGELREAVARLESLAAFLAEEVHPKPYPGTKHGDEVLARDIRRLLALLPNQQRVEELEGALRAVLDDLELRACIKGRDEMDISQGVLDRALSALNPTKG